MLVFENFQIFKFSNFQILKLILNQIFLNHPSDHERDMKTEKI